MWEASGPLLPRTLRKVLKSQRMTLLPGGLCAAMMTCRLAVGRMPGRQGSDTGSAATCWAPSPLAWPLTAVKAVPCRGKEAKRTTLRLTLRLDQARVLAHLHELAVVQARVVHVVLEAPLPNLLARVEVEGAVERLAQAQAQLCARAARRAAPPEVAVSG